jgi:uncharacterized membrane protein
VLSISGHTLILWLHVVAACIWIGGQVTVAALIPRLRGHSEMARLAGRRYQTVAWPAFATLIVTGIIDVDNGGLQWSQLLSSSAGRTLAVKLDLVASALLGSISLLAAVLAALFGVVIADA